MIKFFYSSSLSPQNVCPMKEGFCLFWFMAITSGLRRLPRSTKCSMNTVNPPNLWVLNLRIHLLAKMHLSPKNPCSWHTCRHSQTMRWAVNILSHLMVPTEVEQGKSLPSCFNSHTVNKYPFCGPFCAMFFAFLWFGWWSHCWKWNYPFIFWHWIVLWRSLKASLDFLPSFKDI